MKANTKVLALMALLAAGSASAVTNAGTQIENKATATFTDPTSGNPATPVDSTTVTTTVNPIQNFNIDYKGGGDEDTTDSTDSTTIPTSHVKTLAATETASFTYTAINNGNGLQKIYLTTAVTGVDVTTVKYYKADGTTPLDSDAGGTYITVYPAGDNPATTTVENDYTANNGTADFVMKYTVPSKPGTVVGATPIGTAEVYDTVNLTNETVGEQKDQDPSTPAYDDLWWQYNKVTVKQGGSALGPNTDANADNNTDGTTNPNPSYLSVDTTPVTIYPGGTTPPGGNTPIPPDTQVAIGKCAAAGTTTTVTFLNTVTNTGNADDTFTLTATGTPGATVTILKADGTALNPQETPVLKPTESFTFAVRVSYDGCPTADPTATVTATSKFDGSTNSTTDKIAMPGVLWGDGDKSATTDPTPNSNPNPSGAPGDTVTWPMEVKNTGLSTDTYTPTGSVIFKDINGKDLPAVPVTYTYDAGCDGVADSGTTATVDAGKIGCFVASVKIPDGAAAGTTPQFTQTVTGASGSTDTDPNDTITVLANKGGVEVTKTVDKPAANPGDTLVYTITAKNNYNIAITNFILKDLVPQNTDFVSYSGNSTAGTVIFGKACTPTATDWATTAYNDVANGTTSAQGGTACVAIDGAGTGADLGALPAGAEVTMTFTVKIK